MDGSLPSIGESPREVEIMLMLIIICQQLVVLWHTKDNQKTAQMDVSLVVTTFQWKPFFSKALMQVTMKMAWGQDDDQREGRVSAQVV